MRSRVGLLACLASIGLVAFLSIEPRLHYRFPSMVDDWHAIATAPEELRTVLRLGNPEDIRYRPGFIAWNALQWHTLGAPSSLTGPQLWGVARLIVFVLGVTLLTRLLVVTVPRGPGPDHRWILTLGVPLLVLTVPGSAVDLARYGPQEPLLIGCMSLGAVLLVRSFDRLLAPRPFTALDIAATIGGFAIWSFGVLQKETSTCALVLLPFLLPVIRSQRRRWGDLEGPRRVAIGAVAIATLLPFVPMVVRTVQLGLADTRLYEEFAADRSPANRLWEQLVNADNALHSPVLWPLAAAAVALLALAAHRRGLDGLAIGFLVTAVPFVAFAAEGGVVASRYYLPPLTLFAFALARSAARLRTEVVVATGVVLLAVALIQFRDARAWVETAFAGEAAQNVLVREAAARAAGGCEVDVIGRNLELAQALPVLMPLADEPPRGCEPGQRFVAVVDWYAGVTSPDDPVLTACAPESEPVFAIPEAYIVRCTA
jgi:hypothetical protein